MPTRHVEQTLHVTATRPRRAPQVRGVTGHSSSGGDSVSVDGMPVSSPVHAWIESAAILSVDDLTVMGDGLLRRRRPLATFDVLAAAVAAHQGRRGYLLLCSALGQLRAGTDSARETELRLLIVRAGFPEPEVNGEIRNEFGALLAHGDLVFREEKVLIEYEGGGHLEAKQFAIDIERLDLIMAEGWRVIRVDKVLFADRYRLLNKIDEALRRSR